MPGTDSKASTQHDAATVLGRRPTESRVRPQPPPQDFWFSLGMMIGYYTLSYAFVRLIIVAPIISSFSHKQITKLQRSAKRMQQIVPVGTVIMSLLISFVLSFAIGNRSAILTFYIHFGLAFIGGYFGGEIGQSFTCLAGLLSNLGFNFIWKDDTNGLITTDFSSGHLPILHLYSILQITGLLTGNLSRKTRNAYDHVAKAIEVNIKKVNMDLEITRKALEQGRDREEVKSRYIAFLCEQFHRPLLSIMQNCESTKADQEAIREVIEPVFASTGYLLSLVDDVLSFIQLERGLLRLQPTSLNLMGLLNSALTCANEVFNSQGIFFEHQVVNAPEFIVTDAIRFQQSILNILLTVAENVNPGTQLTLRTSTRFITDTIRSVMSAKDNKSSLLEISIVFPVENMSDSELQALFHPYKMKSDKEGDQGSGLSMAISQRIIELMGGNILAERLKSDEVSISVVLPTSLSPKGVVASKQQLQHDRV
ncbi:hypothetical protein BC830DRAFT_1175190 [Chytriomyces sp. MP71]|nr:hypothetical protein BC830DRAFT_1175190 [Chytriomyces sp. MP71]